ncbi:hypothetical protein HY408_00350 [Candidatus Gottesmanbacteria bacterium]|nr:hypothetical protein [Candidatus Gottesmanbacteria bacterium]
MKWIKNNWPFVVIGIISVLLTILALLTALKLRTEKPVAPTVPQKEPQAISGSPVPACQLSFTLTLINPTPSPSGTPNPTPSVSPSPSVTPRPSSSSTPTPTTTPSPSPTPSATPGTGGLVCGDSCTNSSECPTGLTCYKTVGQTAGVCRHPSCTLDTDCICPNPSSTPLPTPSVTPQIPPSGTTLPTIFIIMGGTLLLILGFALL